MMNIKLLNNRNYLQLLYMIVLSLLFNSLANATQNPIKIADDLREIEQFNLFHACSPINLLVEQLNEDASKINLTKKSIQTAAESRLRSARLYDSDIPLPPILYISVHVVGKAFSINVEFGKNVVDLKTGLIHTTNTWRTGTVGTHAQNAGFILSALSRLMDEFLVEYLRVNEESCE